MINATPAHRRGGTDSCSTVYDAKTRLLVEHPSGRYAVRDRDPGLKFSADGSLTLSLQHEPVQRRVLGEPAVRQHAVGDARTAGQTGQPGNR
jgi:hypothetical protein